MKNIIGIDYGERFIGLAIKKKSLNTPYPLKILDSKDLNIKSKNANDRILKILKEVNATEYITAKGSLNYLDHNNLKKNGIETFYPSYEYFVYKQLNENFNPYVSTLDLIANSEKKLKDIKPTKLVNWKAYLENKFE